MSHTHVIPGAYIHSAFQLNSLSRYLVFMFTLDTVSLYLMKKERVFFFVDFKLFVMPITTTSVNLKLGTITAF